MKMETKMDINSTEPKMTASLTVMSEAVDNAEAVAPKAGGWVRRHLSAGWHFTRHLVEMVIAMIAGMMVLGIAIEMLGEPPGYANLFVEYGAMGVSMSVPMVAWMRYRGHSWSDGLEMTVAMLVPMFALVLPVKLGVAGYVSGLSGESLLLLSHVAMIGSMAALMIYRRDRYAHGKHTHHA